MTYLFKVFVLNANAIKIIKEKCLEIISETNKQTVYMPKNEHTNA